MKKILLFIPVLLAVLTTTHAQSTSPTETAPIRTDNSTVRIALCRFSPPFEMEYAENQLGGFDVAMMSSLCKLMQRNCRYIPMNFSELLTAVETNQADVAVCAITITAQRAERVNFSIPYYPSKSRFLGSITLAQQPFSLNLLDNKTIGVKAGSIFSEQIQAMGIKNATIRSFADEHDLIEALDTEKIELILMNSSTSIYWQNHSSNRFKVIGPVFSFGFGYGIAVNKSNINLLQLINRNLSLYQQSEEFKKAYHLYLEEF